MTPSTLDSCSYRFKISLIAENMPFHMAFLNIFFLEAKIWRFENVYITCHENPQLLIDSLVNVI